MTDREDEVNENNLQHVKTKLQYRTNSATCFQPTFGPDILNLIGKPKHFLHYLQVQKVISMSSGEVQITTIKYINA